MTHLSGAERADYVQEMFTRIAKRYDLMNRLMTAGQDRFWRRVVIRQAALPENGGLLLDLGGGTGDLGFDALRENPTTFAVEADFTFEMLRVGKQRAGAQTLNWSAADALNLPFDDQTYDAVVSGFLMRNVVDLPQALREQYRVLKPGGRIVILDTTKPGENLLSPAIRFHMHTVIPFLGRLISGEADAYTYLPDSSEEFLRAEELTVHLAVAGFQSVGFQRLMFGTIAIHWGEK
jgi:demethylmenaquinone methyltransferase/2-methoxy-6-polyprenyl-1,4-benzoquinol methylase